MEYYEVWFLQMKNKKKAILLLKGVPFLTRSKTQIFEKDYFFRPF